MYVKPVFVQKISGELTGSQNAENQVFIKEFVIIQ